MIGNPTDQAAYKYALNALNETILNNEKTIDALKTRVQQLEAQVLAFFTGIVPDNNESLATLVMAQYGRERQQRIYGDSVNIPLDTFLEATSKK